MRLFFALIPDPDLEENLSQIQDKLNLDAAWTRIPLHQWHLTLAFLGDVADYQIPKLIELLEDFPLPWEIEEARGGFPSQLPTQKPKVFAWEWEKYPDVQKLHVELKRELKFIGIELEDRKFRPHISLYRKSELLPWDEQTVKLNLGMGGSFKSLALIHSKRIQGEIRYEVLSERIFQEIDEYDSW